MSCEKSQMMAGYKSVIELMAEQWAEALERVEVLETELERLHAVVNDESAKAKVPVLKPKQ